MFEVSQSPVWLAKMSLPALIANPAPAECSLLTSPADVAGERAAAAHRLGAEWPRLLERGATAGHGQHRQPRGQIFFHQFNKYFPNISRYFLFALTIYFFILYTCFKYFSIVTYLFNYFLSASNIFVSYTPNIVQVMCGKTHMEVQISFDRPFNGIIFSKGAIDQYNCIYVKPQTGSRAYSFNIMYDQVRDPVSRWPPPAPCRNPRLQMLPLIN